MTNYIYEYYQKINDGTIIVGKWVKLVYDIIIDDIKNKKYTYDAKKAKKAILYIENYCRHHEGELLRGSERRKLEGTALQPEHLPAPLGGCASG